MNNNILAALFAFFFWGRATVEAEDRTNHSSWMRTITFLVLTIAVGLIYLKTLDVPMMSNYFDVRAESYSVRNDTLGERLSLIFNNAMDDEDLDNSTDNEIVKALNFTPNNHSYSWDGLNVSGMKFSFSVNKDSTYKIVHRENFSNPVRFPYTKDSLSANHFSRTYNGDSLRKLLYENYDLRYVVVKKIRKIYTLEPFLICHNKNEIDNNDTIATAWKSSNKFLPPLGWINMDMESKKEDWRNISFGGMCINREKYSDDYEWYSYGNLSNHLGFFTAADISQSNYQLLVHSDCPIDTIRVVFNTPVEMPQLPFKVDEISPYGFTITSPELIDKVIDHDIRFFLKFPAMANKQLVRSLILTTLLTALASLFLTNLYFCLRRSINRKKQDEPELGKRIKIAKCCHNAIVVLLLLIVFSYAIIIYNSWYIILPSSFWIWGWVIFLGFILAVLACEYGLYRYARLDKSETSEQPLS